MVPMYCSDEPCGEVNVQPMAVARGDDHSEAASYIAMQLADLDAILRARRNNERERGDGHGGEQGDSHFFSSFSWRSDALALHATSVFR